MAKKKVTALVLQGGGALGAYELGVVKALFEQKHFKLDIVSGISIGAFSAAVIAGSKKGPVAGLEQLWKMFTTENMPFVPHSLQVLMTTPYNAGMYTPNMNAFANPVGVTHYYDTSPLYHTLDEVIDYDLLNSETSPYVIIGATNVGTGRLEKFTNRGMRIRTEHIVASGSLPPSFPMVNIEGSHYWDGGLFSNTPLQPTLDALEKISDDSDEKEVILVELFPQKGAVPENMPHVFARMNEITFESKMNFHSYSCQQKNAYAAFIKELDNELPKDGKARRSPVFKELIDMSNIDKFTVIRRNNNEDLSGIANFTEKTIQYRIHQGYHDTKEQLRL